MGPQFLICLKTVIAVIAMIGVMLPCPLFAKPSSNMLPVEAQAPPLELYNNSSILQGLASSDKADVTVGENFAAERATCGQKCNPFEVDFELPLGLGERCGPGCYCRTSASGISGTCVPDG